VQLREILATPVVAAVLGFLIGAGLITATAWSRTISTSTDASDSIAVMMMFMIGGMLVASGLLIAYVFIAPGGFLYFGLSLAAGFVIGLGVIAIGLMRQSFRD
jgi:prepilin signal peptidase PulO-like enzyme (type II secretory pathway)